MKHGNKHTRKEDDIKRWRKSVLTNTHQRINMKRSETNKNKEGHDNKEKRKGERIRGINQYKYMVMKHRKNKVHINQMKNNSRSSMT